MGRFSASDVDNYGGQGGSGFFSLKHNHDVAKVRFLYESVDDIEGDAVHEVMVDGKKRYVSCLRDYNESKDKCPFCREGKFQVAKLFIPLYNIDDDQIQIWDRGKTFFGRMTSLATRYKNFVSHIFEVERNGEPGSTNTYYEIYEVDQDDTTLDDFEIPENTLVLHKTADEMEYYLQEGEFPVKNETPVRRGSRGSRNEDREEEESESRSARSGSGRRTPANKGSRRGDQF